jgi:hypothetical protein
MRLLRAWILLPDFALAQYRLLSLCPRRHEAFYLW